MLYNNQKIRYFLKRNNLTINDAAKQCDCSSGTINNLLAGDDIKLSTLRKICDNLGLDISVLFDTNDDSITSIKGNGNGIGNNVKVEVNSKSALEIEHLRMMITEKERLIDSLQKTIEILTNK